MHEGANVSVHDTHHGSIPGGEGVQCAMCEGRGTSIT